MNRALAILGLLLLSACSSTSKQGAAPLTQHDLGSVFATGAAENTVPLRSIAVVAQPMINSISMQYREAREPTRRNAWATNRWAAPPAAMTEAALNRLLANDGRGRCRLLVSLGEFIVDIDAAGKGSAVVVADLRLTADNGQAMQTAIDLRTPLARVEPAEAALALRAAMIQLGERSARWMGGPAGQICQP